MMFQYALLLIQQFIQQSMFIDPPRRAVVPGSTNNNRDYFILSFLWGLILICMVVLVSVITIPYYYHYKMWAFILSCALYPITILLTVSSFLILYNSKRPQLTPNQHLATDKTCQICFESLRSYQFHSYRANRCIFSHFFNIYLLFSISNLCIYLFQAAITLNVFIKYCRDKQLYNHFLAINPTTNSEVFFTVINFLIAVISIGAAAYELYRVVFVIVKMVQKSKYDRSIRDNPVQKVVSNPLHQPQPQPHLQPYQSISIPQPHPHQQFPIHNKNQILESASTERPLSNLLSYFIHPFKFNDIPFSLRPGQKFIPTIENP